MPRCKRCQRMFAAATAGELNSSICPDCARADGGTPAVPPDKPVERQGPKFFHFNTDVYAQRVGLAVGPLKEMGATWLTERIREAWPDLDKDGHVELADPDDTTLADALRIQAEAGNVIRIVRIPGFDGSPYDYSILAHETFHLACGVLHDLGVPHDDHEEAHAYFFEYVYRRFLEFLRGSAA